jgi:hypothetical protein
MVIDCSRATSCCAAAGEVWEKEGDGKGGGRERREEGGEGAVT